MKLKRKIYWGPGKEEFKNDDEANRMLSRSQRKEYEVKAQIPCIVLVRSLMGWTK